MTVTGLNHINLRAEQPLLDRLRDFYRDVIGLKTGYRPPFPAPGYWLYAGSLPVMHLYEAAPGENPPAAKRGPIDHFAFDCTGYQATLDRLEGLGLHFSTKFLPETGHGQIFLIDPAGNRVELQFAETAVAPAPATEA